MVVLDPALTGPQLRLALARLQPTLAASRRASIRLHRPDPGPGLSPAQAQPLAEQHPGTELLAADATGGWHSFRAGHPAAAAPAPPRLPDLPALGDSPLDLGVGVTAVPGHLPGVVLLTPTTGGDPPVWFSDGHQGWNQVGEADRAVVVLDPALTGPQLRLALARLQPTLAASRRASIRLHRPDPGPGLGARPGPAAGRAAPRHRELLAADATGGWHSFRAGHPAAAAPAPPRLPDLPALGDSPLDLGVGVTAVPGHLPGVVLLTPTTGGDPPVWFSDGHQGWNQVGEADRAVVVLDPALTGPQLRLALARLQPTLAASRRASIRLHRPRPGAGA